MKTWRERIAEARARGKFDREDVRDVGGWFTCAVGEQHANVAPFVVVQSATDGPIDKEIDRLGMQFMGAVDFNDFDEAERLLDAIEDRALTLKRGSLGAEGDEA